MRDYFSKITKAILIFRNKYFRHNWPQADTESGLLNNNVAIVIVNYNTRELIALLLFSIYKNLGIDRISSIVVVDNNSNDGSKELLSSLERNNLISLISNKKQKYHGPAINQGIKFLLKQMKYMEKGFKYILILDSDTIILKNTIIQDAINYMEHTESSVIGEFQQLMSKDSNPHVSSIIISPEDVWKRKITPFINDGEPPRFFYKSVRKNGLLISDFQFRSKNYVLHLGESTLSKIFLNTDTGNQYYDWANKYHRHHYHNNPKGQLIFEKVLKLFDDSVGELTSENMVNVLKDENNLTEEFKRIMAEMEVG